MEEINLPVPFISQEDPQANEDAADACGPDCITMILKYLGEKDITVNQVFERTGAFKGELITIPQLEKAIASYGYTSEFKTGCRTDDVVALLKQGISPIALVHYENLTSREDQKYKGPHFIVIDGIRDDGIFSNDPDFFAQFRSDGDHHFYTMADFLAAWGNCHLDNNPDNSLLIIHPKDTTAVVQPQAATPQVTQPSATVEAAAETQPQPNLQDKYDHIQKLFLDVCQVGGVASVDDRDLMAQQLIEKINSFSGQVTTANEAALSASKKAGDMQNDLTEALKENDVLNSSIKSLTANYQASAEENGVGSRLAVKYLYLLKDKESALEAIANDPSIKAKAASGFQIIRKIYDIVGENKYYKRLVEDLNTQLQKTKQPAKQVAEGQQTAKPQSWDLSWFRF
jgi:Peptidase_C39 like family